MKKLFIISILAIGCVNNLYAESCGVDNLDASSKATGSGYAFININSTGWKESNYGITRGSGVWALEFDYGTVWGMARCSSISGNHSNQTWPESSKSNWLKEIPVHEDDGQYCWCQVIGFAASGSDYTQGPQCLTTTPSLWVNAYQSSSGCRNCPVNCSYNSAAFRAAMYGAAGVVPVGLAWYDNGTAMSGGPSSCTVGGTFVPPTPPARPGYNFAGWKIKPKTCGIPSLDTSINGSTNGYTRLNGNAGRNESNYGLTTGSGKWATEFSYGTVWGMAKCSETSGNHSFAGWPESSKSDWLKTPSDTTGGNCWCQATGFTASGNSYTSGPQCTTTASSLWVFDYDLGSSDTCAAHCPRSCADRLDSYNGFRVGAFGSVGQ